MLRCGRRGKKKEPGEEDLGASGVESFGCGGGEVLVGWRKVLRGWRPLGVDERKVWCRCFGGEEEGLVWNGLDLVWIFLHGLV